MNFLTLRLSVLPEHCTEYAFTDVSPHFVAGSTRLGWRPRPSTQEVKTRFKELVKRHHPDANGGDRSSEDKLREIIQAYNYLKSIGFR